MLGRRIERLIFLGVLLTFLCLVESYLATANRLIGEDRHGQAVELLSDRLEAEKPNLVELFESPAPHDSLAEAIRKRKRESASAEVRRKLGLPPRTTPNKEETPAPPPKTYSQALNEIIGSIRRSNPELYPELIQYADPSLGPLKLIEKISKDREKLENSPTTVWGIQTPRRLQVQYGGTDYKFPYALASIALEIALTPLVIGWLVALTVTRQRELLLIAELEDYKLTFPHVLNILPVHFIKIERQLGTKETKKAQLARRKAYKRISAAFRTAFILLVTSPMLFGVGYAFFQLLETYDLALIPVLGFAVMCVMCLQVIALTSQEWMALHEKEFYE